MKKSEKKEKKVSKKDDKKDLQNRAVKDKTSNIGVGFK